MTVICRNIFFAGLLLMGLSACKTGIDKDTYGKFQNSGSEITNQAQAVLLSNVGSAIQKGGTEFAVEFCHLKASPLIDSLSQVFSCNISRVSEKNRNPNNALNKTERELWKVFQTRTLPDTLLRLNSKIIYYKRIHTAMPACLKCHGNVDGEIDSATLEKIQKLYPNDLATGYQLNDFRGLWKVVFEE
ncbi:DUF3365 domain-containing protein [Maribellus sp. YY47]|uniref:c-type heme family protein n=1 Tax=Maribellus sp. YY47 TaxID=2929486 RepID=UPI0020014B01|nr:DUF3365 domain-containing protein [Maribellus sp. YY47]MCK3683458.1 DUF3365 domain-containing protein [Maribellus sp. YY47]